MNKLITILIAAAVLTPIFTFVVGTKYGLSLKEREAIIGGFAEWNPDAMGRPVFTWK